LEAKVKIGGYFRGVKCNFPKKGGGFGINKLPVDFFLGFFYNYFIILFVKRIGVL
jgi:hypothetical protein